MRTETGERLHPVCFSSVSGASVSRVQELCLKVDFSEDQLGSFYGLHVLTAASVRKRDLSRERTLVTSMPLGTLCGIAAGLDSSRIFVIFPSPVSQKRCCLLSHDLCSSYWVCTTASYLFLHPWGWGRANREPSVTLWNVVAILSLVLDKSSSPLETFYSSGKQTCGLRPLHEQSPRG